jgi:aminopeptidase-like protein
MSHAGHDIHDLATRLYPFPRSITGDGVRQTLRALQDLIPVELHEVPSGSRAFDWTVPPEWNVREAWIADRAGRRIVDIRDSILHLVSYSTPLHRVVPREELLQHLHWLPEQPDRVPFRNSYYTPGWGFCVTGKQLEALTDPDYEVRIDATLEPGALTYGECVVPGESPDEVLVSAHVCHSALANDNLSGVSLAAYLARWVGAEPRRWTYRFVFAPATIGAIVWLSENEGRLGTLRHGLTLACVGDGSPFHYRRTFAGNETVDRAAACALRDSGLPHELLDFEPYGYDERQYNSPGFRLPVGGLTRGQHGRFPEYHTSADNLDFIRPEHLAESFDVCRRIVAILEDDRVYESTCPRGEPQLGRRGLYRPVGGGNDPEQESLAMLWVLNLADGMHSLLDMAEKSRLPFPVVSRAAGRLREAGLLVERGGRRERAGDLTGPSKPLETPP